MCNANIQKRGHINIDIGLPKIILTVRYKEVWDHDVKTEEDVERVGFCGGGCCSGGRRGQDARAGGSGKRCTANAWCISGAGRGEFRYG